MYSSPLFKNRFPAERQHAFCDHSSDPITVHFLHTPTQGLGERNLSAGLSRLLILPILRFPEFLLGVSLGNRFLRVGGSSRNVIYSYLSAISVIVILSLPIGS